MVMKNPARHEVKAAQSGINLCGLNVPGGT